MTYLALYLLLLPPSVTSSPATVPLKHRALGQFRSFQRSACVASFSPFRAQVKNHFIESSACLVHLYIPMSKHLVTQKLYVSWLIG